MHITMNGADLGYEMRGAKGDKASLLFAHGYAMRATGTLYGDLLDRLADHFAIYALDLRGHGSSAASVAGWSYEAVADDLAAFAPTLGIGRPIFLGHSFGCVVGLLAEIRHPGAFKTMCLLEPGPADSRSDPVDALDAMIKNAGDREGLRAGFTKMFVHECADKLKHVLDAAVLVDADVHEAQKEQNPHFSIDDRLEDVVAPVLIVCGKDDSVIDPARQHDMAGKLRRSKEVVFSGEGHMLAVERPEVAAREIVSFLDSDRPLLAEDA